MSTMFKVFVGNLNFRTTEQQLRELFEKHFTVEDVVIVRDPGTQKPMGYGFVMTKEVDKGRAAIARIGKAFIEGRLIYLKEAHGKKISKKKGASGPPAAGGARPPRRPFRRNRPVSGGNGGSAGPAPGSGYVGMKEEPRRPQPPKDGQ